MRFGRYELLQRLACGGMGEVFRAHTVGVAGFQKPIALKRIFPHLSEDIDYQRMFIREAKVTAELVHPNIAQVYDLGETDGRLFIAMEFVEGCDLGALLGHLKSTGESMPPSHAAVIAFDVLEALDFAHNFIDSTGRAVEIVHRDVSPQNVLLSRHTGVAKLCDFGVARANLGSADGLQDKVVGKYAYMPLDQLRGEPAGVGSDLWAVGVVLHEMLTGRPLHTGKNVDEVLDALEQPLPPLKSAAGDAPEELAAIVDRSLSHRPEARYQSANEMRAEIEDFLAARQPREARLRLREQVLDLSPTTVEPNPLLQAEEGTSRWTALLSRSTARHNRVRANESDTTVATPRTPTALVGGRASAPPARSPVVWLGGTILAATVATALLIVTLIGGSPDPVPLANEARPPDETTPPATESPAMTVADEPEPAARRAIEPDPPESELPAKRPKRRRPARSRDKATTRPSGPPGYLSLSARPWANVTIDGEALAKPTPIQDHPLRPGRHVVVLRGPNGKTRRLEIKVTSGKTITKLVDLE